ncbi:MAG TPA: hypothetical protein VMV46_15570, partial [Thermoanaerobaculia bacterium]|nr:hypothetical protein [Thermoanaerobaculia bacterium]
VADGAVSSSRRPKVWAVLGCVALPLLVGVGVLALLAPRAVRWVEGQRAVLTAETGAPASGVAGAPDRPANEDPASGGEDRPAAAADEAPAVETADSQAAADADDGVASPPAQRSAESVEPPASDRRTASASTDAPRPSAPSPTSPRQVEAAEPRPAPAIARAEPEPAPEEPEPEELAPADEPVVEAIPFDSELQSSLQLSLAVEPEEAFVLLRSPYDERFTNIGQAMEFDASKRRGQPFALPGDGVFYVMLRAEGYGDYVVKVTADPRRPAPTTLSLRMGRPGQRASGQPATGASIQVREGITFGDGSPRARVEVDGRDAGLVRRYQDGRLLPLGPGRHFVVVILGPRRVELEVEVSATAPAARQVVELGGGR